MRFCFQDFFKSKEFGLFDLPSELTPKWTCFFTISPFPVEPIIRAALKMSLWNLGSQTDCFLQVGHGSARRQARGSEEDAQRVPVSGVVQASIPRAEDAVFL